MSLCTDALASCMAVLTTLPSPKRSVPEVLPWCPGGGKATRDGASMASTHAAGHGGYMRTSTLATARDARRSQGIAIPCEPSHSTLREERPSPHSEASDAAHAHQVGPHIAHLDVGRCPSYARIWPPKVHSWMACAESSDHFSLGISPEVSAAAAWTRNFRSLVTTRRSEQQTWSLSWLP